MQLRAKRPQPSVRSAVRSSQWVPTLPHHLRKDLKRRTPLGLECTAAGGRSTIAGNEPRAASGLLCLQQLLHARDSEAARRAWQKGPLTACKNATAAPPIASRCARRAGAAGWPMPLPAPLGWSPPASPMRPTHLRWALQRCWPWRWQSGSPRLAASGAWCCGVPPGRVAGPRPLLAPQGASSCHKSPRPCHCP